MSPEIRDATERDAAALAAIYAPLVRESPASFELEPPDAEEFARRIQRARSRWALLVAEAGAEILGYAYGGELRSRPAYGWSVETSVYVASHHHRKGVGRGLYARLLDRLTERGFRNAYAGIVIPNEASVALHEAAGFERIGVFPRVGFKLGAWHDVAWMHRPLGAGENQAPPLAPPH